MFLYTVIEAIVAVVVGTCFILHFLWKPATITQLRKGVLC